jgi:hypothetical protein
VRPAEAGGGCCGKSGAGNVSDTAYDTSNKHAGCRESMARL